MKRRVNMSKPVADYIKDFQSIVHVRENIIRNINDWFKKIAAEPGLSHVCEEIKPSGNSIAIKFLEFNIFIRIDICASKNIGFIKWFYMEQRPDDKTVKVLIIKDEFDKDMGIKGNDLSKMGYSFSNMVTYCFDTLGKYLDRVDKRISEEEVLK
jgi:hypothetical protein